MKKSVKIFFCLIMSLSLCACSQQKETDIYDLCENFNSLSEEDVLFTESFVKEKQDNNYHCFVTLSENTTATVCAFANESNSIYKITVTVIPESADSAQVKILYDFCVRLFAAFEKSDEAEISKRLEKVNFTSETALFSGIHNETTYEKTRYTLHSNNAAFTFSAEAEM